MSEPLDPGAYIGQEPELEEETIPGGLKPGDERVAAHDAAPGVPGEPNAPAGRPDGRSEFDRLRDAGQAADEGSSNGPDGDQASRSDAGESTPTR